MKKRAKRLTALILVLSLTTSLLSSTAWAAELAEEMAAPAEASMVEVENEPMEDVADEPETQVDEVEPTEESEGAIEVKLNYADDDDDYDDDDDDDDYDDDGCHTSNDEY